MKLRPDDHRVRPWRIHEIAPGFEIHDVWGVKTPGGPNDFARLIELVWATFECAPRGSARLLWAIRWKVGEWMGWDRHEEGLAGRVRSLRENLHGELAHARSDEPSAAYLPFRPVYKLENEWAAELANGTVHGVLHLGWIPDAAHGSHGRLTVLVQPNGWRGRLYLAVIAPFRPFVYRAWVSGIERSWSA